MSDPTTYFTGKVEQYVKYRPSYPHGVIDLLEREGGLTETSVVADVGAGPGNLTRLFLAHHLRVYAVEPNAEMRAAAERLLGGTPGFTSVAGSAEATGLPAASVDMVVAGQAFHWFDPERARAEFKRILRPPAWVALIWNERRSATSPLQSELNRLIARYVPDFGGGQQSDSADTPALQAFFGPDGYRVGSFDNRQPLDLEGFIGRVMSTSYAPLPDTPTYSAFQSDLRQLFAAYEQQGLVAFEYDTRVYYGRL